MQCSVKPLTKIHRIYCLMICFNQFLGLWTLGELLWPETSLFIIQGLKQSSINNVLAKSPNNVLAKSTCTWSGSMRIACRTLGLMVGELGRALEESWCILSQGWCDGWRIATWRRTTKVRVVASSGLGRLERKYPWNIFYFTLSCPNISSYPLYHFQKLGDG